jgi:hypothetical protein
MPYYSDQICGSYKTQVTASSFTAGNYVASMTARCVRGSGTTATTPAVHYTINPATAVIDAGTGGGANSPIETVTDNWTGLTWQRQIALQQYADVGTYCAQFGNGFRLPTTKELLSLIDPTEYSPAIDRNAFPNTPSSGFYASTPVYSSSSQYSVNFDEGTTEIHGPADGTGHGYVRCVK